MNKYGLSPLEMMTLLGPMFVIVPLLLWFLVIGPLVLYPIARWRAHREPIVDPQLGLKVALHYFRMLALQLLLLGGVLLIFTIISKGSADKGDFYRAAFGFLVPAAIVYAAHASFLGRTNDEPFPAVRRLFLGYNLLVTGLIGLTALVLGCQALFAKGSSGDAGRMFLAAVLVYCGAWAWCGVQFARGVLGPDHGAAGGPPANVMPPPSPDAQQGGGAQLPSLGAGSFPPIEPQG